MSASLRSASVLLALVACGPATSAPPPVAPASVVAPATDKRVSVELPRMADDVRQLATDEMRGRYTMGPEIETAAAFLQARYESLGIGGVDGAFAHRYPLTTGVELASDPAVEILGGKRKKRTSVGSVGVVPGSASADVEGQLVFAGYAEASELGEGETKPSYDDLAKLDLEGKVVLVLAGAPDQPDSGRLGAWLGRRFREAAKEIETLAGQAEVDSVALRKAHEGLRKDIATALTPYLRGQAIPAAFFELPQDLKAPLNPGPMFSILTGLSDSLPGPHFAPARLSKKIERLQDAGASAVIVVRGPRSYHDPADRSADPLPDLEGRPRSDYGIPVVQMKWREADRRFRIGGKKLSALQEAIDTKLVSQARALDGTRARVQVQLDASTTAAPNVLATIPGTDLAHEVVMIGAHFDHVGVDEEGLGRCHAQGDDRICNGADDNASGTAMVLEIARLLKAGPAPRRTIVFAHFSGEELGLLGSKALAAKPPSGLGDLSSVVAMINLDMVGRLGPKGLFVGGLGSSAQWEPLLDSAGTEELKIIYDRAITARSDHASFYEKNIPVLFFFTGVHSDYHRPGDEFDKLDLDGMGRIGNIVARVTHDLAHGAAIPFTPPRNANEGLVMHLPGDKAETVLKRVP